MIKVECITEQLLTADLADKINTKCQSLTASGNEVLHVYPVTIGDARYIGAMIEYETSPQPKETYITQSSLNSTLNNYATKADMATKASTSSLNNYVLNSTLNSTLSNYAKKSDVPTVPTKVSQLTNDSGYITRTTADGLYQPKATGV